VLVNSSYNRAHTVVLVNSSYNRAHTVVLVNSSYKIKDLKSVDMQLSVLYVVMCTESCTVEVFNPK